MSNPRYNPSFTLRGLAEQLPNPKHGIIAILAKSALILGGPSTIPPRYCIGVELCP